MKHHPIALVVDFQFTIKPFSLSWPNYRIFLPFVVHFSPRSTEPTRRSSEKSGKPVGVGAVSQRLTATGERSVLLTHTGTTGSVWLCTRMKKLTASLELESVISGSLLTSCNGSVDRTSYY